MPEPATPVVLGEDWRLLQGAFPSASDDELVALVVTHARIVATADGDAAPEIAFARRAGAVGADRALAVVNAARLAEVVPQERRAYEELTHLRIEVVPGLKRRAREARDEVDAIALDAGPRYESDADRRRSVAEFFGRTGGGGR